MIVDPVLIIGAPRSGTSLLQKILRNHPAFWSLPSESELIWDQFCHPQLRDWSSECMEQQSITTEDRQQLLELFELYMRPASFWKPFEKANLIWGFKRMPIIRRLLRNLYKQAFPLIPIFSGKTKEKRLLEKTASNCFRLDYVNEVFPNAKIIYPTRDGRNNVNSLINAWLHPTRFFTYAVPAPLNINGYPHKGWKFILPPKWRDYTNRSLQELCAFQWRSCHEAMLNETSKDKYQGRVLRLKLEDLVTDPQIEIERIAKFVDIPFDHYLQSTAARMPIVNSQDNDVSLTKWRGKNRTLIEEILPTIEPMMQRLGYEI